MRQLHTHQQSVIYSGFSVEIQNTAASETIRNTITALRQLC